jgi:hypothetical protein
VRRSRWGISGFCILTLGLALGGCVEATTEVAPTAVARVQVERRTDVSLADATVAIVSVEGAPDAIAARFTAALRGEAKSHDITLAEPSKARYLARGYLSASASSDGAEFEYVWDIFGPDRRRAQRLNDVIAVKGSAGDDPWSLADAPALNSAATKSAEDLAAFLSNTPDAKPSPSQALSFAGPQ